jgi:hypothetical protein
VLTGGGPFTLKQAARQRLKQYLDNGGFLLASASCSNAQWASSFRKLIDRLYPERQLQSIPAEHSIRHTLYDIDRIDTRRPSELAALEGLKVNGLLAVVFSPVGLNNTDEAGGGCCCCGGNEITNARQVNANILTYALTH